MAVLSSLVLLGLAASSALADPAVLHMPLTRNAKHPGPRLAKRASNTAQVTVVNDIDYGLYYVNATVGTPGQEISLVLDTGSSDVWMFGPGACAASVQQQQQQQQCFGGECTSTFSLSLSLLFYHKNKHFLGVRRPRAAAMCSAFHPFAQSAVQLTR